MVEDVEYISPALLGLVQRGVRVLQQAVGVAGTVGKDAESDADRHIHLTPPQHGRRCYFPQDRLRAALRISLVAKLGHHDHKLVTTQSRHRVRLPHCRA